LNSGEFKAASAAYSVVVLPLPAGPAQNHAVRPHERGSKRGVGDFVEPKISEVEANLRAIKYADHQALVMAPVGTVATRK
jgi:hypothetical protein